MLSSYHVNNFHAVYHSTHIHTTIHHSVWKRFIFSIRLILLPCFLKFNFWSLLKKDNERTNCHVSVYLTSDQTSLAAGCLSLLCACVHAWLYLCGSILILCHGSLFGYVITPLCALGKHQKPTTAHTICSSHWGFIISRKATPAAAFSDQSSSYLIHSFSCI